MLRFILAGPVTVVVEMRRLKARSMNETFTQICRLCPAYYAALRASTGDIRYIGALGG